MRMSHATPLAQALGTFPPLGINPRGFHGLKPFFCEVRLYDIC